MRRIESTIKNLKGGYANFKHGVEDAVFLKVLEDTKKKYGERAVDNYSTELFKLWNATPEFENTTNRERLQNESGVIISNHPGIFDIPIVLEALKDRNGKVRRDVKILVHEANYTALKSGLGEEYFIKLKTGEYTPAKQALDTGIENIKNGGVFVIFPSGGKEQSGEEFKIYPGLAYVLERMQPQDMVYSFGINTSDFKIATQDKRRFMPSRGAVAGVSAIAGVPSANLLRPLNKIRVNESYSQAEDWQSVMQDEKSLMLKAETLTKKYLIEQGIFI